MKANKAVEKILSQLEDAKIFFEELQEKKQESFDNKSEKWQESEKGEEAESDISSLEELAGECENLMDSINNVFEAE